MTGKKIGNYYKWEYKYIIEEESRWEYYLVIDYNPRNKFYMLLFDDGSTDDYRYTELLDDKKITLWKCI